MRVASAGSSSDDLRIRRRKFTPGIRGWTSGPSSLSIVTNICNSAPTKATHRKMIRAGGACNKPRGHARRFRLRHVDPTEIFGYYLTHLSGHNGRRAGTCSAPTKYFTEPTSPTFFTTDGVHLQNWTEHHRPGHGGTTIDSDGSDVYVGISKANRIPDAQCIIAASELLKDGAEVAADATASGTKAIDRSIVSAAAW